MKNRCDVGSQEWKEGIPWRRNSANGRGSGKLGTMLEHQWLFQESYTIGYMRKETVRYELGCLFGKPLNVGIRS